MNETETETSYTLRRAVLAAVLNPAAQASIADALAVLDQARAALADVGLELAGIADLDRGHAASPPLREFVPYPELSLPAAPKSAPPATAVAEPALAPEPEPAAVVRHRAQLRAKRKAKRVARETKPAVQTSAGRATCDRAERGGCKGKVQEIACQESGCRWVARRCEAHGRSLVKTRGAHLRIAHLGNQGGAPVAKPAKPAAKPAPRQKQTASRAARGGRPARAAKVPAMRRCTFFKGREPPCGGLIFDREEALVAHLRDAHELDGTHDEIGEWYVEPTPGSVMGEEGEG